MGQGAAVWEFSPHNPVFVSEGVPQSPIKNRHRHFLCNFPGSSPGTSLSVYKVSVFMLISILHSTFFQTIYVSRLDCEVPARDISSFSQTKYSAQT